MKNEIRLGQLYVAHFSGTLHLVIGETPYNITTLYRDGTTNTTGTIEIHDKSLTWLRLISDRKDPTR